MPKKFNLTLLFIIITIFLILSFPKPSLVNASISSCTADATPSSAQPSVNDVRVDFTIWNYDAVNSINWFRITKPFSGITFKTLSLFQWTKTIVGDSVVFSGNTITPYQSKSPYITVDTDSAGGSGSWTVEASDDGGSTLTQCSGSLSFEVSTVGQDQTPPVISSINVSNVSTNGASVSWETNEAATTELSYGIEHSSYPFNNNDTSNYVTTHSRSITNLSSGVTYYYLICSTDASGNQACSDEGTFTTVSVASATATPTAAAAVVTATPTPTTAVSATPTPTPIPVDRTPPKVSLTTELEGSYEEAPLIEGSASDNEKITKIDYSTDGGVNWLPVDESEGIGTDKATFSFTPYIFEDGSYEIIARAIDDNENTGTSDTLSLVLDRLPPRVGGNLISIGPQPLIPNQDGVIITMKNLQQKITMSSVGGATEVSLFVGDKKFDLTQSSETGLWSGYIELSDDGLYELKTKAIDGAGNKTERDLNPILVVVPGLIRDPDGKPVENGTVTLYIKDSLTNTWTEWDGKTFSQENPQEISAGGEYQYFLPAGEYYLEVSSSGHQKLTSRIFKLNDTTAFNADFTLKNASQINLLLFKIPLPSFLTEKSEVKLKTLNTNYVDENSLVDTQAATFSLPTAAGDTFDLADTKGKAVVLSFISTWSPLSLEQIPLIDKELQDGDSLADLVAIQETASKLSVFIKKGKYHLDTIVDADGELVEKYHVKSLPTHFFIDRKGVIKKVVAGVLTKEEFDKYLVETR